MTVRDDWMRQVVVRYGETDYVEGERWQGERTTRSVGSIEEVQRKLPAFDRRPFTVNPVVESRQMELFRGKTIPGNRYYDVIIRKPLTNQEEEIPVGIVSKKYTLIQHKDVMNAIVGTLSSLNYDLGEILVELQLTEYGGRMGLGFILPQEYDFDPGDGHPIALRLQCFNSVDRSTLLRIALGWFRFVCCNGMVVGTTRLNISRIHNEQLDLELPLKRLRKELERADQDRRVFSRWLRTHIHEDRLVRFVDGPLRKTWGVLAAARAYHIANTGYDGAPAKPFEKSPPSRKEMNLNEKVPGISVPVGNAFALSQILAWLAKERRDIQEQQDRMEDIPKLMRALLK